jgi:hypothetical protein
MATIKAEDVRIPRSAREAVAHHEDVVVLNRERPVFVIVHPDSQSQKASSPGRGRSLSAALSMLAQVGPPDPAFAEDMESVLESVGSVPGDPWASS